MLGRLVHRPDRVLELQCAMGRCMRMHGELARNYEQDEAEGRGKGQRQRRTTQHTRRTKTTGMENTEQQQQQQQQHKTTQDSMQKADRSVQPGPRHTHRSEDAGGASTSNDSPTPSASLLEDLDSKEYVDMNM